MLYDKLMELAEQIESMIADGVQLIHAGQIFDWKETVVLELLEEIKKERGSSDSQYGVTDKNQGLN